MANRAYLLNTPFLVADPYAFRNAAEHDYLTIDGPGYRLPIPWLCFFRQQDLKAVVVQSEDDDGNACDLTVRVPSVAVSEAIRNLEQARPLFEQLTGESHLAQLYWDEAMAFLRALPLPWLTLESLEVVGMYELQSSEEDLFNALAGTVDALPYLKDFSDFIEGTLPFPPDVLVNVPGPYPDDVRIDNAVALDVSAGAGYWHRADGSAAPDDTDFLVPPRPGLRDLGTVLAEVEALMASRVPEMTVFYGFAASGGNGRSPLKLLLLAPSETLRDVLLRDQRLRMTLDGPVTASLHAVCSPVGIDWTGFVFASDEGLTRTFGTKIDQWITLAPTASYGT